MDVPQELSDRQQWCLWRDESGRKVPYQPSGQHAMTLRDILITGRSAGAGIAKRLDDQKAAEDSPRSQDAKPVAVPGLPAGAVAEYRFHSRRRWRFDYAWPAARIALEIEGGVWTHGRHTRGKGFVGDMEKYNAAALAGWRVLRVTPQQVTSGEAGRLVRVALALRGA
jgi:hypothetical protein